jgi:hypothetical protein
MLIFVRVDVMLEFCVEEQCARLVDFRRLSQNDLYGIGKNNVVRVKHENIFETVFTPLFALLAEQHQFVMVEPLPPFPP